MSKSKPHIKATLIPKRYWYGDYNPKEYLECWGLKVNEVSNATVARYYRLRPHPLGGPMRPASAWDWTAFVCAGHSAEGEANTKEQAMLEAEKALLELELDK